MVLMESVNTPPGCEGVRNMEKENIGVASTRVVGWKGFGHAWAAGADSGRSTSLWQVRVGAQTSSSCRGNVTNRVNGRAGKAYLIPCDWVRANVEKAGCTCGRVADSSLHIIEE